MTRRLTLATALLSPVLALSVRSNAAFTSVAIGPYSTLNLSAFTQNGYNLGNTTSAPSYYNSLSANGVALQQFNFYDGSATSVFLPAGSFVIGLTSSGYTPYQSLSTVSGKSANRADATNASGLAVGFSEVYTGTSASATDLGSRPVVWNANGTIARTLDTSSFGTLASGGTFGEATAINDNGVAAGYSNLYDASHTYAGQTAVRWSITGVATALPSYYTSAATSGGYSVVNSINNSNIVVGESRLYNSAGTAILSRVATRWDASGALLAMQNLGTDASGNQFSVARQINNPGTSIGWSDKFVGGINNGQFAAKWDANGVITPLGTLSPAPIAAANSTTVFSSENDINDAGTIVGTSYLLSADGTSSTTAAVVWAAGSTMPTALSSLVQFVAGKTTSSALAIDTEGYIVGYSAVAAGGTDAVLWSPDGTLTDLNTLIDPSVGFRLTQAYSIDDGGWITGLAQDSSGDTTTFLMQVPVSVPEPASLGIMGLAILPLLQRRRKV